MKSRLALWLIAAGLLISTAGILKAQDTTNTQQSTTTTTTTTQDKATTTSPDTSATPSDTTTPQSDTSGTMQDNTATPPPSDTTPTAAPQSDKDSAMTPPANAAGTSDQAGSNVRSLTGCLQKGDSAKEYALMGQDGSTWEIRSDAVDLASHVGQTVMVTGAVNHSDMHNMKEDAKREAQEHGMDKSATEHGHLTVTDLNVVSKTCSAR